MISMAGRLGGEGDDARGPIIEAEITLGVYRLTAPATLQKSAAARTSCSKTAELREPRGHLRAAVHLEFHVYAA